MKMAINRNHPHHLRGFTLVELLGVILIITVLAGLSFGGFQYAQQQGKRTVATNDIKDIVNAVELFYSDYSFLPEIAQAATAPGAPLLSADNDLLLILTGKEDSAEPIKWLQWY